MRKKKKKKNSENGIAGEEKSTGVLSVLFDLLEKSNDINAVVDKLMLIIQHSLQKTGSVDICELSSALKEQQVCLNIHKTRNIKERTKYEIEIAKLKQLNKQIETDGKENIELILEKDLEITKLKSLVKALQTQLNEERSHKNEILASLKSSSLDLKYAEGIFCEEVKKEEKITETKEETVDKKKIEIDKEKKVVKDNKSNLVTLFDNLSNSCNRLTKASISSSISLKEKKLSEFYPRSLSIMHKDDFSYLKFFIEEFEKSIRDLRNYNTKDAPALKCWLREAHSTWKILQSVATKLLYIPQKPTEKILQNAKFQMIKQKEFLARALSSLQYECLKVVRKVLNTFFKFENLEQEKEKLIQELQETKEEKNELCHYNEVMSEKLKEITDENNDFKVKLEDISAKFNLKVEETKKLQNVKESLSEEVVRLNEVISRQQEDHNKEKKKIVDELDRSKRTLSDLENDNTDLAKVIQECQLEAMNEILELKRETEKLLESNNEKEKKIILIQEEREKEKYLMIEKEKKIIEQKEESEKQIIKLKEEQEKEVINLKEEIENLNNNLRIKEIEKQEELQKLIENYESKEEKKVGEKKLEESVQEEIAKNEIKSIEYQENEKSKQKHKDEMHQTNEEKTLEEKTKEIIKFFDPLNVNETINEASKKKSESDFSVKKLTFPKENLVSSPHFLSSKKKKLQLAKNLSISFKHTVPSVLRVKKNSSFISSEKKEMLTKEDEKERKGCKTLEEEEKKREVDLYRMKRSQIEEDYKEKIANIQVEWSNIVKSIRSIESELEAVKNEFSDEFKDKNEYEELIKELDFMMQDLYNNKSHIDAAVDTILKEYVQKVEKIELQIQSITDNNTQNSNLRKLSLNKLEKSKKDKMNVGMNDVLQNNYENQDNSLQKEMNTSTYIKPEMINIHTASKSNCTSNHNFEQFKFYDNSPISRFFKYSKALGSFTSLLKSSEPSKDELSCFSDMYEFKHAKDFIDSNKGVKSENIQKFISMPFLHSQNNENEPTFLPLKFVHNPNINFRRAEVIPDLSNHAFANTNEIKSYFDAFELTESEVHISDSESYIYSQELNRVKTKKRMRILKERALKYIQLLQLKYDTEKQNLQREINLINEERRILKEKNKNLDEKLQEMKEEACKIKHQSNEEVNEQIHLLEKKLEESKEEVNKIEKEIGLPHDYRKRLVDADEKNTNLIKLNNSLQAEICKKNREYIEVTKQTADLSMQVEKLYAQIVEMERCHKERLVNVGNGDSKCSQPDVRADEDGVKNYMLVAKEAELQLLKLYHKEQLEEKKIAQEEEIHSIRKEYDKEMQEMIMKHQIEIASLQMESDKKIRELERALRKEFQLSQQNSSLLALADTKKFHQENFLAKGEVAKKNEENLNFQIKELTKELLDQNKKHQEEIQKLRKEKSETVEELQKCYYKDLKEKEIEYSNMIRQINSDHLTEINKQQKDFDAQITSLRKSFDEQLKLHIGFANCNKQEFEVDSNLRIQSLKDTHKAEIEKLKKFYSEQISVFQKQTEILKMQQSAEIQKEVNRLNLEKQKTFDELRKENQLEIREINRKHEKEIREARSLQNELTYKNEGLQNELLHNLRKTYEDALKKQEEISCRLMDELKNDEKKERDLLVARYKQKIDFLVQQFQEFQVSQEKERDEIHQKFYNIKRRLADSERQLHAEEIEKQEYSDALERERLKCQNLSDELFALRSDKNHKKYEGYEHRGIQTCFKMRSRGTEIDKSIFDVLNEFRMIDDENIGEDCSNFGVECCRNINLVDNDSLKKEKKLAKGSPRKSYNQNKGKILSNFISETTYYDGNQKDKKESSRFSQNLNEPLETYEEIEEEKCSSDEGKKNIKHENLSYQLCALLKRVSSKKQGEIKHICESEVYQNGNSILKSYGMARRDEENYKNVFERNEITQDDKIENFSAKPLLSSSITSCCKVWDKTGNDILSSSAPIFTENSVAKSVDDIAQRILSKNCTNKFKPLLFFQKNETPEQSSISHEHFEMLRNDRIGRSNLEFTINSLRQNIENQTFYKTQKTDSPIKIDFSFDTTQKSSSLLSLEKNVTLMSSEKCNSKTVNKKTEMDMYPNMPASVYSKMSEAKKVSSSFTSSPLSAISASMLSSENKIFFKKALDKNIGGAKIGIQHNISQPNEERNINIKSYQGTKDILKYSSALSQIELEQAVFSNLHKPFFPKTHALTKQIKALESLERISQKILKSNEIKNSILHQNMEQKKAKKRMEE